MAWPKHPIIYEIHTWVWLYDLAQRYQQPVTLATVPDEEWDAIAALGIDAVWLMGVWERSPAGRAIARTHPDLQAGYREALPDFRPEDVVGSPYCVRRYQVDEQLGGTEGLASARQALIDRGIRLILDFVPNHVAPDHPWVASHPEYFIHGNDADLSNDPGSFIRIDGRIFAFGRDPYFPAWTDVLQLNAFGAGLRSAVIDTLTTIGAQCDGVRCDMAMLLLNHIFERTWSGRAGIKPKTEYWSEVISAVHETHPEMLFMAEAYWDLEWDLQRLGFDYCYDKRLYDRLKHDTPEGVRQHLRADLGYQEKLVRFLENHDEPRAAATFAPEQQRVAAVATFTLPGARFFHEGQFEGRKVRPPVQLRRRPQEPVDADLQDFYRTLLGELNTPALRDGEWRLLERSGWPDNASYLNLVAWSWRHADERVVIVVNLSDAGAQGQIQLPWDDLSGRTWLLKAVFSGQEFERSGDEMMQPGLYVSLGPREFHVLRL